MKWPRLPRRRERQLSAPRLYRERLRFYLAGILVLILAFIVSLYVFFPVSAVRERIEREVAKESAVDLRIGQLALRFPPGFRAQKIVLGGIDLPGRDTMEIAAMDLKPLWTTLFGGNPGLSFRADLLGGRAEGEARKGGELSVRAAQIAFAQPVAAGSSMEVAGLLQQGTFAGSLPLAAATETRLELLIERLRVTGLESMGVSSGELSLGSLSLQGSGKGRNFKIDRLESTGGDLQVSGSGSLLLNQTAARSRISLVLMLQPGPSLAANLRDLLELFAEPQANGIYRLRLNGSLASPIFAK